jgi:hypothetical protein
MPLPSVHSYNQPPPPSKDQRASSFPDPSISKLELAPTLVPGASEQAPPSARELLEWHADLLHRPNLILTA